MSGLGTWDKITGGLGSTTTEFGGNWGNLISDLFNGIDIGLVDPTKKPIINTEIGFKPGKLKLFDFDASHYINITMDNIEEGDNRNIRIRRMDPPYTEDFMVMEGMPQTILNKNISGSSNTITNIGDSSISTHTSTKISINNKAQLPSNAVYTDQANLYGVGVMQSFRTGQIRLFDTNASHTITLTTGDQTANVNAIFPVLGASDTITFLNQAQILTQKEIDTVQNVLKNLGSHQYDVFLSPSDSLWKARNRTTGAITSSNASLTTVLQAAINGLTAARTNIESVKVWGVGTHDKITLPSYTRLDLSDSKLTFVAHANLTSSDHQFTNSDHTNGNTEIQIINGQVDGNRTNQPPYNSIPPASEAAANTFHLVKCTDSFIIGTRISNTPSRAVAFYDCVNCYAAYTVLKTINAEGIQFHQGSGNKMLFNDARNLRQSFYTTHESPDGIIHGNYGDTITASTSGMNNSSLRTIVTNNIIKNTQLAAFTMSEGSSTHEGSGSIIAGNTFSGSATGEGISIVAVTQTGLIIANNNVYGNATHGIRISGVKNGIVFEGNQVHENAYSGIVVQSGAGGLLPINVSVKGNFCWNNGTALDVSDTRRAGIVINGAASPDEPANIWIEGNHCFDTRSGGSKTQKYGIYSSNSLNSKIANNNVRDNSTDGIVLVNSNTGLRIFENPGYSANIPLATTTGTETFANKTLTSPTINGGTLSGTFTLPSTAATGILFSKPADTGAEKFFTFSVADATNDNVTIENLTTTGSRFVPAMIFTHSSSNSVAGNFIGRCDVSQDTGTNPLFRIDGRQTSNTALSTRPIFDIATNATPEYVFGITQFDMKGNTLVNAVIDSTVTGITDANISAHTSTKITITNKSQLPSDTVYTGDTQTLSSKTLTSPTINAGTLSGTFALPTAGGSAITFSKAADSVAEKFFLFTVADATNDNISIENATTTANQFRPAFIFQHSSSNAQAGYFIGRCDPSVDTGTNPLFRIDGRLLSAEVSVRPIFSIDTFANPRYVFSKNQADFKSNTLINAVIGSGVTGIVDANINAHTSTKITITAKGQLNTQIAYKDETDWLTNAMVNSAAAIGYEKLNLTNSIVAGDITSDAVTTAKILDANVTGAKIASDTITNTNVKSDAAIAWGKLSKTGSILDDLDNVDVPTPAANDVLTWDDVNSKWIATAAPGAAGGEANTITNVGTGVQLAKAKVGVDIPLRTVIGGTGIDATQNTDDVTIDIDSTVVTLTGTQTLTNKTLTSPTISLIVNTGTLTLPTSTDTLIGRETTDTLTNKTLTSPVINSPTITNSGNTLTLPTTTDTLVGRATTDTLTNKTLSSPTMSGTVTLPSGTTTPLIYSKPATAGTGNQEQLMKWVLSDDANSYMQLQNATGTENVFVPQMIFRNGTNTNVGGLFQGEIMAGNDSGTTPAFRIDGRRTTAVLGTRPILGITTFAEADKFVFYKDRLVFGDTINIEFNTTTGTKIGTATTQKLSFWNATPVTQRTFITSPTADTTALKTAVDAIRQILIDLGLMAAS